MYPGPADRDINKTVYSDSQVPSVIYCSTNFRTEYRVNGGVFATPAPWGSNVWQTNIPGIGLYYQFNPIVYPSANGVNFPGEFRYGSIKLVTLSAAAR